MNLSRRVIGCAIEVHRTLGSGFLESVYERALAWELTLQKISFQRQVANTVMYKGHVSGTYIADLIVQRHLVIELKAVHSLANVHEAQLINYLNAARLQIGLLLNFGTPTLQIRRLVNRYEGNDAI